MAAQAGLLSYLVANPKDRFSSDKAHLIGNIELVSHFYAEVKLRVIRHVFCLTEV